MKKIIITGPTGAIGMALIQKCVENNMEVTAVCHRGSARMHCISGSDKIRIVECNLNEIEMLPDMLKSRYDIFFHLAWACTSKDGRNNVDVQAWNVHYTLQAVETAKKLGCTCFVGAGSQAEYGRFEGRIDDSVPPFPENAYGISKLCAGQLSRIRCGQLAMRHIWFRIFSVFGMYDGEQSMIMDSIRSMLKGVSPEYTPAEQIWDYLYAEDAAEALLLGAKKGKDRAVYCLGSGHARPLKEYIEIMRNEINPQISLKFGAKPYEDKQVMHLCADITKLQEDTGFVPQYDFMEGIRKTIMWVREQKEYVV